MTLDEIQETIQAFADAAALVKAAGFDGVELHGATGYLLSQFLSPRMNKREYASRPNNELIPNPFLFYFVRPHRTGCPCFLCLNTFVAVWNAVEQIGRSSFLRF